MVLVSNLPCNKHQAASDKMLPPSFETLITIADSNINPTHRNEPEYYDSSSCARPQMAWQMYKQLLRIACNQQQSKSKDEQIDMKRVWLAAFTGPSLTYSPGVAAGAAEPL